MSMLRAVRSTPRLRVAAAPCDLSTALTSCCAGSQSYHTFKPKDKICAVTPISVMPKRWRTRKGTIKMPPTKPLSFAYGGDVEWSPLVEFDKRLPAPGYENVPELETADERVKRLYSLAFADGRQRKTKEMEFVIDALQENAAEEMTLESNVVRRTVHIRKQITHCLEFRKDKRSKAKLIEGMHKRGKYLKELQRIDGERFDWLTKELNINFVPISKYSNKLSKKQKRKKVARDACFAIIDKKMAAMKVKLEKEKKDFAAFKEAELESITKELGELGLEMKPTIEETVNSIDVGRQVIQKEKHVKRRRALLEKKFELYGIHGRNRGKDARIKFP